MPRRKPLSPWTTHHGYLLYAGGFGSIFMLSLLLLLCLIDTCTLPCINPPLYFQCHGSSVTTELHHLLRRWQDKWVETFGASKAEGRENISWLEGVKLLFSKASGRHLTSFIWLEISSVNTCHLRTLLVFVLLSYWDGTREKFMHRPSSPSWGRIRETRSYCRRSKAHSASRRPLIGVYHFVCGGW